MNIFIDGKIMQDKYEYYPRPLIQTSQKVRKSRMSPGAGAGVEPDFKFLPEPEWSRVKNLASSATLTLTTGWDRGIYPTQNYVIVFQPGFD